VGKQKAQESLFPGLDFTHLVLGMRTGMEDEHKRAPSLPCTMQVLLHYVMGFIISSYVMEILCQSYVLFHMCFLLQ
jgi:hypothetical protein